MCLLLSELTELETRMCFFQCILKHVETRVCFAMLFRKKLRNADVFSTSCRNAHVFAQKYIDNHNVFFCVSYEIPGAQVSNITVCVFGRIQSVACVFP